MASGDIQWSESYQGYGGIDAQPFLPQSTTITYDSGPDIDAEGDEAADLAGKLSGYSIIFNQAYILNTVADGDKLSRVNSAISNMKRGFELKASETMNFGVEVIRSKENLLIEKATFTGWSGQEWLVMEEGAAVDDDPVETPMYDVPTDFGEFPEIIFKDNQLGVWNPVVPENSGDQGYYTGYFPVCKMQGNTLLNFTLRSNIELSDRQFKQMGQYLSGGLTHNDYQISGYEAGSGWRNLVVESGVVTALGAPMGFGEAQVLIKEGKEEDTNPVRVRSVSAGTGIAITQEEQTIVIDSTFAADSSWSGINTDRNWYEVYGEAPAFTHPDGTAADPAKFRTLEEGSGITLSYQGLNGDGDYERIRFDVDLSGVQLSGIWSGECCGDYYDDTYCTYVDYHGGAAGKRSMGTLDDPALFRRLTGDGTVTLSYLHEDPFAREDECIILISGECCSGVDNAGDTGDGVGIYKEGTNDPALLRRLIGGGLLTDEAGGNLIYTTPLNHDNIIVEARWSGQNITCTDGVSIYKQPTDGYDGKMANPAEFKQLVGADNLAASATSNEQINVLEEGANCVRVRGNGVNGSLTIASGISINNEGSNPVIVTNDTITIAWEDGLITTQGNLVQDYNTQD
tara:strand:- start:117 stop:1997 length:1881 start_codon:yes stop_codon:yes gene_type:complete